MPTHTLSYSWVYTHPPRDDDINKLVAAALCHALTAAAVAVAEAHF